MARPFLKILNKAYSTTTGKKQKLRNWKIFSNKRNVNLNENFKTEHLCIKL